jgi:hypothetical protein
MDGDGKAERNAKIYARRIEGFTLRAIAREFVRALSVLAAPTKASSVGNRSGRYRS